MKDNESKSNHFDEDDTEQPRKSMDDSLMPERNAVIGFTFKGMGMFLLIVVIGSIIKYFFY